MFELTYIYHDGFLLKTPSCVLIFDYWMDPTVADNAHPRFLENLSSETPLYIFVSHFHKDHLNKSIFNWAADYPNVRYIISPDVRRHVKYLFNEKNNNVESLVKSMYRGQKVDSSRITVLKKLEEYEDDNIIVTAFGSTDIGNSYGVIIKAQNLKVFHAGDLNCWSWDDESSPEEILAAENAFHSELLPIAEKFPEFDAVMFPVDSRIGSGYVKGTQGFLSRIRAKRFFPMHFSLGESAEEKERYRLDALDLKAYASGPGEFITLTAPYDSYLSNA